MKKLIYLITIFCTINTLLIAQTTILVSGVVEDSATNLPIPIHQVEIHIFDSLVPFYYNDTVYTDSSGYYRDTIQNYPIGTKITVKTLDCLNNWHFQHPVDSTNYIADFSICLTPPCQANFWAYPDTTNPATWHFINQTIGNPTSWYWTFGDGDTSYLLNPTHTYQANQSYIVTLNINCGGMPNQHKDTIIVTGVSNCQANFSAVPDSTNPYKVHFIDQSTGNPTTYSWTFGDNTNSTLQNPDHTYNTAGDFNITLTISGPGCQSTKQDSIFNIGISPCQANFNAVPDSINNLIYNFQDLSTGSPNSWLWTFGDGNTSNVQNPTHTYSQAGVYIIYLTISGPGCQSYSIDSITANFSCSNSFSYSSTGYQFSFQGSVNHINTTTYIWDFGDSSPNDTSQIANHYYPSQGNYQVCLSTISIDPIGDSCTTQSCQMISVPSGPTTNLFGQIFIGTSPADTGYVVLYNYNWFDSTYIAVDSTNIDKIIVGSNQISTYYFNQLPPGQYLTKAFLDPASIYSGNYSPTYSGNFYAWDQAIPILIDTLIDTIGHTMSINMIELSPPMGNTNVSGYVLECASKSPGDPIPNVPIFLLEYGTVVVAYTVSDQNGYYEFNNLEAKPYSIFAELINKKTNPINVHPDGSGNPISNYNIYICSDEITGIENTEQLISEFNLYPNPFIDKIAIDLYLKQKENININIYTITGQMIHAFHYDYLQKGFNKINLKLSSLPSGLYVMDIRSTNGWTLHKKIVKN